MSDLISREEVIEALKLLTDEDDPYDEGYNLGLNTAILEVKKHIPTAEPKMGKWIRITQDVGIRPHQYMCSECHRIIEYSSFESPELLEIKYPYCHCGAKMKRRVDEHNT